MDYAEIFQLLLINLISYKYQILAVIDLLNFEGNTKWESTNWASCSDIFTTVCG